MLKFRSFITMVCFALLTSCVSREDIVYFNNAESLDIASNKVSYDALKIKPNDQLNITVSADEVEAAMPFNLPFVGKSLGGADSGLNVTNALQSYLVNSDGEIQFPVIGTIEVAGLNRKELSIFLEKKISEFIKNPIVNVRISNFQITVLGEVARPGTFSVSDEYLSLPKALGLAGDLTIYGKRKNVLIIRELENGDKQHAYLDLTDSNFINSPYYYLQQNDVVYVEPNAPQIQSSSYNRNASVYISIASVLVSLAVLITR
ncbi:polysaccharide biosynthesis/export family protein [Zunongwangia sp. SCSIO 43204]|uniref:polysaccharide biosynthesis/export family protein n=1 Tax=Zunongwangia sp. SCSIO 43204 TaxID=2779359 RepID=UPI001CA8E37E|nr:polysaccharide biosynthesis/export family protein [Zunongwangia sp. SCSIO 43204]UAB84818.1 polysaccharide biosynthesis/export family protein [Zunongwangia sp. SCSIO 43204]